MNFNTLYFKFPSPTKTFNPKKFNKAIEADQSNRMMFHLGKDYALFAELFNRKGDRLKAKENLGKAIEIFKECGADGWVEKYEKELAQLS